MVAVGLLLRNVPGQVLKVQMLTIYYGTAYYIPV